MVALNLAKCFMLFSIILCIGSVCSIDLSYSDIITVTDETRFRARNPGVQLVPFNKRRNVKGNYIFSAGERVSGDHLAVSFFDETQLTKTDDVEVELVYPSKGENGATLTLVQINADFSAEDGDAYFYKGGIGSKYAGILLVCNQTRYFTFELFIYGY